MVILMKLKISNMFVVLFLSLFFSGCGNKGAYTYRTKEFNRPKKPIATVEKAWLSRHKYDHERRMLIPMVGGARWGAVQEYKEDGTLEYKDWWVRDVKIEDLEAKPSTTLSISNKKKIIPQSSFEDIDLESIPQSIPLLSTEDTGNSSAIPFEPLPSPGAFSVENSEVPVSEAPFAPLPFDSLPSKSEGNGVDAASPFAPLPDAFPPL
jgi:uncharacterized protein YlzI (FlbEa/FlbD family)